MRPDSGCIIGPLRRRRIHDMRPCSTAAPARDQAVAEDRRPGRPALRPGRPAAGDRHAAGLYRLAEGRTQRWLALGGGIAAGAAGRLRAHESAGRHGLARPIVGARPLATPRSGRRLDRAMRARRPDARLRIPPSLDLPRRGVERAVLQPARFPGSAPRRLSRARCASCWIPNAAMAISCGAAPSCGAASSPHSAATAIPICSQVGATSDTVARRMSRA
ncbi:hypothetical protein BH11PSE3_BH11PSE3_15660 [soil metagenome]